MCSYQIKGHDFQKEGKRVGLNPSPHVSLACSREPLETGKGDAFGNLKMYVPVLAYVTLSSKTSLFGDQTSIYLVILFKRSGG